MERAPASNNAPPGKCDLTTPSAVRLVYYACCPLSALGAAPRQGLPSVAGESSITLHIASLQRNLTARTAHTRRPSFSFPSFRRSFTPIHGLYPRSLSLPLPLLPLVNRFTLFPSFLPSPHASFSVFFLTAVITFSSSSPVQVSPRGQASCRPRLQFFSLGGLHKPRRLIFPFSYFAPSSSTTVSILCNCLALGPSTRHRAPGRFYFVTPSITHSNPDDTASNSLWHAHRI